MNVTRRAFLATSGALAAGAFAPGRLLAALQSEAHTSAAGRPAAELATWPGVRRLFSLAPGWTHLSSFFLASHPRPVREAIEHFRRAIDADPYQFVEHAIFASEQENLEYAVRTAAARYMGGVPEEVALTGSTTMGLGLVYAGLSLRPGDEILVSTHDHFVHHESARLAAERTGATARRIALYDRGAEADRAEILARIRRAVRPETRVLGLTWVHSSTGVRLPIRDVADLVAEINRGRNERTRLLFVVDGVHGFGCSDEPEAKLGCDFFCAGTHKWILGPRGTGVLWAPRENWSLLRPTFASFSNLTGYMSWMEGKAPPPVSAGDITPGGFHAFEHVWGTRAAFELHGQIGRARIAGRVRELNARCRAGLASMRHVTLHTPADPSLSAGLQCFEMRGRTADEGAHALIARKVVASSSPYAPSYVRLAPSLVNDEADVDRGLAAVAALARA